MMNSILLLIPHFNNQKGLLKSISSIDEEERIDVLIVDDGSIIDFVDEKIIRSHFRAKGDVYFKYLHKNKGIEIALNTGLSFALENKFKYVARLDCGDICIDKRFEIQRLFLENNPNVMLVGSNVKAHGIFGEYLFDIIRPTKHKEIEKKMYLNSMFIHPAVMFSVDAINILGMYPTKFKSAEDYAYFFKFVKSFEVANINQFLTQIEINNTGISYIKRKEQVRNRIKIIIENFYFGFYPVYGILRSLMLYIIPYELIFFFKKKFLNDGKS